MKAGKAILATIVGIMACPLVVQADAAGQERLVNEHRQALFALFDLMLTARPEQDRDNYEPDPAFQVVAAICTAQPRSARDAYAEARERESIHRRRLSVLATGGVPSGVPTLEDKDLNRADREILAELDAQPPRTPAPSGDDFVIRLFEMYTALGAGWSESAPGNEPPIKSTPDPVRAPASPPLTPADFERITRESAEVYQDSIAATQRNAEDWQRRQEAIDRTQDMIRQTGDVLRQQQDDWRNRHPDLPAPPSTQPQPPPTTTSKPPPATTSRPPSHPGKPSAGSSGGQRSGDRQGGTVKRTDKPPSGGVKSPPATPQSHRCQKCGKISPRVYFCQKCHLWHCPGQ